MVDFSAFVPEDGLPIYLQIIRHVKRAIAAGTVQAGDELPSRRVLSAQLGVNPNTVQKAYRLLEEEGLQAAGGRGDHHLPLGRQERDRPLPGPSGADPQTAAGAGGGAAGAVPAAGGPGEGGRLCPAGPAVGRK